MRILVSICSLMLAGALASNSYEKPGYGGYGHSGPGRKGHGYTPYNLNDLAQLEKMIHDVGAEKIQLGKRVIMLKDQESTLLAKIDNLQTVTIPALEAVQTSQDASLEDVRRKIKTLLHDVVDAVSALDGEVAVSKRQEGFVNGLWARIFELVASNNEQTALLAMASRFLDESKEKLNTKLIASKQEAEGKINELKDNTKAFGNLVNTRKCYNVVVPVVVDPKTSVTNVAEYFPENFFGTLTPTAYCAIVGFGSHINLDDKKQSGYGYGYNYEDMYQNLAVTIDCKPFADRIIVSVFDQSKGANNQFERVYVTVKVCTLGPQSSGLDHV